MPKDFLAKIANSLRNSGPNSAFIPLYFEMNQQRNSDRDKVQKIPLDRLTDNELLVLYVNQECEAAFDTLVKRHSAMVLNVCLSVVSDHNRAEDAFQATFLAVIRHAKRLRKSPSFAGWLYRVAYRAGLNALKLQRRESGSAEIAEPLIELDPLRQLAAREVVQTVVQELDHLPERQREAITLFYFEQLPRNEIAKRMDCSPSSIKALLQRGKQILKMRLLRKGIVPSMVALSLQAVQRCANAADLSSLVSSTVTTCAAAGPSGALAPPHLTDLATSGEWAVFTSNSIIAKTGVTMTGIIAFVAIPLLFLVGTVPAQSEYTSNDTKWIAHATGNSNPHKTFSIWQFQQESTPQEKKKPKSESGQESNNKQLQAQISKLENEVRKLEERQKQLVAKRKLLTSYRIKLAKKLMQSDMQEFRKFAATAPGKSALIEIFINYCLATDEDTKEVFVADERTRNIIYMKPDGELISVVSTIDAGGGPNNIHARIEKKETRKIVSTILKELGRVKAENVRVNKYPNARFHISRLVSSRDESPGYALTIEGTKKVKQ